MGDFLKINIYYIYMSLPGLSSHSYSNMKSSAIRILGVYIPCTQSKYLNYPPCLPTGFGVLLFCNNIPVYLILLLYISNITLLFPVTPISITNDIFSGNLFFEQACMYKWLLPLINGQHLSFGRTQVYSKYRGICYVFSMLELSVFCSWCPFWAISMM